MQLTCEKLTYRLLSDIEDDRLSDLINSFSCNNSSIDRYLQSESYLDHYEFNANTTLVFSEIGEFVAYFTLKQGLVKIESDGSTRSCLIAARLGVKAQYQNMGVGTNILQFIGAMAEMFNQRYITIDAVWEYRRFYSTRGFSPFIKAEYENPNEFGLVYMFVDLYDDEKVNELFDNP